MHVWSFDFIDHQAYHLVGDIRNEVAVLGRLCVLHTITILYVALISTQFNSIEIIMDTTQSEIQSSAISTLTISKARKKNGYYACPIYSEKRYPFYINIQDATLLSVKEIGSTLTLKCKNILSYMDNITSMLLRVVELNHTEWFNSSIDETFIEEYFTTPIHYDNNNGIVLRLKIKNIEDIDHAYVGNKINVILVLKNITFLRQKFYPLFEVHSLTMSSSSQQAVVESDEEDVDVEDEDVVPSFEEVLAMKNEKLSNMKSECKALKTNIDNLSKKFDNILQNISNLESCKTIDEILKYCEEITEEC